MKTWAMFIRADGKWKFDGLTNSENEVDQFEHRVEDEIKETAEYSHNVVTDGYTVQLPE